MIKRLFDIVVCAFGLVLLLPAFVIIAVAIRLNSAGPIFFRQTRIGLNGVPFNIHKFRTMLSDRDGRARQITVGRDPRITSIGHFLRKYKLDELPQLIDVLCGNMSLVGPRPEVRVYVDRDPPDMRALVLSVRPGITDTSSLKFIDEADILSRVSDPERYYVEEIIPIKLQHHSNYVENRSFCGDVIIIISTVNRVMRRR